MILESLTGKILATIAIFFAPIVPAMIAVGILIVIDTTLGLIAANKNNEHISSKKLGRVLTKMLVYQLLIISSHLVEQYLFPIVPMLKITIAFCGMTEFLSLSENFQKITGKNFIMYIREFIDNKFRGMLDTHKVSKEDINNTETNVN